MPRIKKQIRNLLIVALSAFTVTAMLLYPLLSGNFNSAGAAPAPISGNVFRDYNANAVADTLERGQAGIVVTAYGADGTTYGPVTTDFSGNYTIPAVPDDQTVRVEFDIPSTMESWLFPSTSAGNDTVQFATGGDTVNFAVNNPGDYCEANPNVLITCYENGTGNGPDAGPALISFPYDFSGTAQKVYDDAGVSGTGESNPTPIAGIAELGSAYGIAYQSETGISFASSVLKRHVGFGDGGVDAIYITDGASLIADFNLNGAQTSGPVIDLGSVDRTSGPDYTLPDSKVTPSTDLDAYAKIGKVSFGDIDITEDGEQLWAVNLNQRSLINIDISGINQANPTAFGDIEHTALEGLPGYLDCGGGVARPWGLNFQDGLGYLGVVCDNSLTGKVLSFDPTNISSGFSDALVIDFGYTRESSANQEFKPWSDDWGDIDSGCFGSSCFISYPQPMIIDIDFSANGMEIGVGDRHGLQTGYVQYAALPAAQRTGDNALPQVGNAFGDILHACYINGSYVLENTTNCAVNDTGSPLTGSRNMTNDGPSGGGEWYWGDYLNFPNNTLAGEQVFGSIAVHKQNDQTIITDYHQAFAGNDNWGAQGVSYLDVTGGGDEDHYMFTLATGTVNGEPRIGNEFGKANGLGDIELACSSAPLMIGNYVWIDADNDGIQDPDEAPVAGATVNLYKDGVLVATAVTNSGGQYYFLDPEIDSNVTRDNSFVEVPGGFMHNMDYVVRMDNANDYASGGVLENYLPTTANSGTNDENDSDGVVVNNYPETTVTIGGAGENNYSLDFGFYESTNFDLALSKVKSAPAADSVPLGTDVTYDITVYNQGGVDATNATVIDYIPSGLEFVASSPINSIWTHSGDGVLDADGFETATTSIGPLAAGENTTVQIVLKLIEPGVIVNWAEISSHENAQGLDDIDSTPDSSQSNDTYTTDNDVTGVAKDENGNPTDGDEDDHDPAQITSTGIFDLALDKKLSTGQDSVVFPGSDVNFTITVYNQGDIIGNNIRVVDYFDTDNWTFNAADNPNWEEVSAGLVQLTDAARIATLAAGADTTVDIVLELNSSVAQGGTYINFAEISEAENDFGLEDIDSTPDTNPDNDIYTTDNEIDEDGKNGGDEDDHDPAEVTTHIFDLALRKIISSSENGEDTFLPGDEVTFDIQVFNQGTVDATNVEITEYIPTDLEYIANPEGEDNSRWTYNGDGTATTVIDSLAAGADTTIQVTLRISSSFIGTATNYAEISSADNAGDLEDIDSTPDSINGNTPGESTNLVDNEINGDGKNGGDEDDHDCATITSYGVFDLALRKTLNEPDQIVRRGSDVVYNIEVFNQGTIDGKNIVVTDYLPPQMHFDPTKNPNWTYDNNGEEKQVNGNTVYFGGSVTATGSNIIPLLEGDSDGVAPYDHTQVLQITLTVDDDAEFGTFTNFAEISSAENDPNIPDSDSTPDKNPDNDDYVNDEIETNPNDEDDHDGEPVTIQIFDLALRKTLAEGQSPVITPGDIVAFSIEVFNQGNVTANNVDIVDYVPSGLTFVTEDKDGNSINDEWELVLDPVTNEPNGKVSLKSTNLIPTIAADDEYGAPYPSVVVNIYLQVNAGETRELVNTAEISDAENDYDIPDEDSTPDEENNDPVVDDEIEPNDDDEDDHDIAVIQPIIFDLALDKMLAEGQNRIVEPGDFVDFVINIYNQGTVDADEINIVDYIPNGMSFVTEATRNGEVVPVNAGWSEVEGAMGEEEDEEDEAVLEANDDEYELGLDTSPTLSINLADLLSNDNNTAGGSIVIDETLLATTTTTTNGGTLVYDSAAKTLLYTPATDFTGIDTFEYTATNDDGTGENGNGETALTSVATVSIEVNEFTQSEEITQDADVDSDSMIQYLSTDILPAGESRAITLTLQVDADFIGVMKNYAEIADANPVDENGETILRDETDETSKLEDIDSTPDMNPNNDGLTKDNVTNEDRKSDALADEDDYDCEEIESAIFDLALRKKLSPGQSSTVEIGSNVSFDIEVFNQGTVEGKEIKVIDYLPVGLSFKSELNPNWSDNGNGTVSTTGDNIISSLLPGESVIIKIVLTVKEGFSGEAINTAEIQEATNDKNIPDTDSTPDTDPNNDILVDDEINNAGGDEDDHDIAKVTVLPPPTIVTTGNDSNSNLTIAIALGTILAAMAVIYFLKKRQDEKNMVSGTGEEE